jgi:hypothetical protein
MNRAWPATPLLMIVIGTGLLGFGVWAWFTPLIPQRAMPYIPPIETAAPGTMDSPAAPGTARKLAPTQQVTRLLTNSPYSPTREAFSRTPPRPPAPKAQEYQPQFIGLLGKGERARAMVIWKPGEPEKTHAVGDQTPWGTLVSASGERLVLRDGDTERTLTLF